MINVGNGPPSLGLAPSYNGKELACFRSKEWGVRRGEGGKRDVKKTIQESGEKLDGWCV